MDCKLTELTPVTLTLEKAEALLVLITLGNFVVDGLDKKLISTEDFIRWEKLLNNLLKELGIPLEAQVFLRKFDQVIAVLAQ